MIYLFFFVFTIFLLIIYLDRSYSHRIVKKELRKLDKIQRKIISHKYSVKCSTFTVGRKNIGFHYNNADLYFAEDALMIAGYFNFLKIKVYRSLLILTAELDYYKATFQNADEITTPNQLNINSSRGDVYIEFGDAGFTSTNVSIQLKNLSKSEKELITIKRNYG